MDKKNENSVTNEDLKRAFEGNTTEETPIKKPKKKPSKSRKWLVFNIVGGICFVAGIVCLLVAFLGINTEKSKLVFPEIPSTSAENAEYSLLTGEPLSSPDLKNAPVYCIQTPNGTDGARPQAGLNEAGVIFEAIAEAGITRFAAIYQNPTSAVIGPIRSLRIYYLQWDTPFDCTIVHAGGSGDALAAVSNGYKNLDENNPYMYRGTYGNRLWNNLFTTAADLKKFNTDYGYNSSNINGFTRLTPAESEKQRADESVNIKLDITKATAEDTSAVNVPVPKVALNLGSWADFNISYTYNADNNTYLRSYGSGATHDIYKCPPDELGAKNPEDVCSLTQMAPSVVVAMIVKESKASDNYHEDIAAIGSGDAYIFQNGTAFAGTWSKASAEDQIKFTDKDGNAIKLAPGQTFITAVPNYGSIEY